MNDTLLPIPADAVDNSTPAWSWKDQRVLVLGLGLSGLAMARWCARLGAQVTVADTRSAPPQWAVLQAEHPEVAFVAGALDAALLQRSDTRTRSAIQRRQRTPSPDGRSGAASEQGGPEPSERQARQPLTCACAPEGRGLTLCVCVCVHAVARSSV